MLSKSPGAGWATNRSIPGEGSPSWEQPRRANAENRKMTNSSLGEKPLVGEDEDSGTWSRQRAASPTRSEPLGQLLTPVSKGQPKATSKKAGNVNMHTFQLYNVRSCGQSSARLEVSSFEFDSSHLRQWPILTPNPIGAGPTPRRSDTHRLFFRQVSGRNWAPTRVDSVAPRSRRLR